MALLMTLNHTILQLCKELEDKMYDVNKQIQAKLDLVESIRSADHKLLMQTEIEDLEEKWDYFDTQRSDLLTMKTILEKFVND
jgi:hypothetical protein